MRQKGKSKKKKEKETDRIDSSQNFTCDLAPTLSFATDEVLTIQIQSIKMESSKRRFVLGLFATSFFDGLKLTC